MEDKGWYGYFDANGNSPGLGSRRLVEADVWLWSMNPGTWPGWGNNPGAVPAGRAIPAIR